MFKKVNKYDGLTKEELKELFLKLKYECYCAKSTRELKRVRKEWMAVDKRLLEIRKKEKQNLTEENKNRR